MKVAAFIRRNRDKILKVCIAVGLVMMIGAAFRPREVRVYQFPEDKQKYENEERLDAIWNFVGDAGGIVMIISFALLFTRFRKDFLEQYSIDSTNEKPNDKQDLT